MNTALITNPAIIGGPTGDINMATICNDGIACINGVMYWNMTGKGIVAAVEAGLIYLPAMAMRACVGHDGRVYCLPVPIEGVIFIVSDDVRNLCPHRNDLRCYDDIFGENTKYTLAE